MNKKIVYFALALLLIGFLLVESSMYILPYIEGFKACYFYNWNSYPSGCYRLIRKDEGAYWLKPSQ